MSANTLAKYTGRPIELVWKPSAFERSCDVHGIEHAYVGEQRLFSILNKGAWVYLHTHFPQPDGQPYRREELRSLEKAKKRADEILELFIACLFAEPKPNRQAS
ncbi:hypothetical protein ACQEVF_22220 [Nonomuraea polychroma]|uniref:hypothetical protein n=1 Tax=Nonomuraea polychroma TaxID=46176 RepID=UPI003D91B899